jgi:hypothetical protein
LNLEKQDKAIDEIALPRRDITNLPLPRLKTKFQQPS